MSDLKKQLLEFAAKRAVSEIVRITARNLENKTREEIRNRKIRKVFLSIKTPTSIERTNQMARQDTAGFTEPNTRRQAAGNNAPENGLPKEPVEFWVNTVIVRKDGSKPMRLLTGRPLKAFKATREVTTSNEEFNEVNVFNNVFVNMMNDDATTLNFGESKYYSPQGITMKGENPHFKAGIYFQLHREETDYASAAAEKHDKEAAATQELRKLFGN